MNTTDSLYLSSKINGCDVDVVIFPFYVKISILNPSQAHVLVDLTSLRLKIRDWYWYVPYALWLVGEQQRSIEVDTAALAPIDNLTYIEEIAKEKGLI